MWRQRLQRGLWKADESGGESGIGERRRQRQRRIKDVAAKNGENQRYGANHGGMNLKAASGGQ